MYCTVIAPFTLRARNTMFRHITVQQRQTHCYWDSYREVDPHNTEQTSPVPLSHWELNCRNNPALVPSGGDCILSHHPSCYIWIFPPCSSNSGPRINRVQRHIVNMGRGTAVGLCHPSREKRPCSKHESTQRQKALSSAHIQFP